MHVVLIELRYICLWVFLYIFMYTIENKTNIGYNK